MNKIAVQTTNSFLVNPVNPVKIDFSSPILLRPYITISLPRCLVATWPELRTPRLPCLQRGMSIAR